MKQNLRLFLLTLLCAMVGTTWGEEVTIASFTASTYNGGTTNGWTVNGDPTYSSSNNGYYQLTYSNCSIVTPNNIDWSQYSDITITIGARKYGGPSAAQGKISVSQGTTELATYSPSSTSIVSSGALSIDKNELVSGALTISCPNASSGKGCGVQSIIIKGKSSTPSTTPKINVTANSLTLESTATSGEISYTITNPVEGTSLTASSGANWISNIVVGSAKVTFTTSENTSTSERSATITLKYSGANDVAVTVKQKGATGTTTITPDPKNINSNYFVKVTSVDDLEDGDAILIVNEANLVAMDTTQNKNNRASVEVTITTAEGVSSIDITEVPTAQKIVLVKSGDYWYLYTGKGYLYASSNSSNQLKTEAEVDANGNAKATLFGDDCTIIFNGKNSRNQLKFNTSSSIFACYESGQSDVAIYKEVVKPTNLKTDPVFAFSPSEYWVAKDRETFTAPTLSTAENYDGAPSYSSDNEEVATVDATTGAITIVGVGTATITAQAEATDNFYADEASYTINVYEIEDGIFEPAKGNYLSGVQPSTTIGSTESTWKAGNVTMNVKGRNVWYSGASLRLYKEDSNYDNGSITISVPEGYIIGKIVLTGGTNLVASVGKKSGTTWTGLTNSVTFTHDGESGTVTLSKIVVTYINQSEMPQVTISDAGYATLYYGNWNLKVPSGVTAYTVTLENNKIKTTDIGSVIPAGYGVVLEGAAGTYNFEVTEAPENLPEKGVLEGTDEAKTISKSGYTYYVLSLAQGNSDPSTIGFYWDPATDGTSVNNGAHKAYLKVATQGNGEGTTSAYFFDTTGIRGITTTAVDSGEVYTLSGMRVKGQLSKGIYIVNGKKMVIK